MIWGARRNLGLPLHLAMSWQSSDVQGTMGSRAAASPTFEVLFVEVPAPTAQAGGRQKQMMFPLAG